MSLCATGMPVRGCAAPLAIRPSAARAWPPLLSSSTVMKAFSLPFSALMRPRKSFVSSTLEIFFGASPEAISLRDACSMGSGTRARVPLYHHLGNKLQTRLHVGRRRELEKETALVELH